MTNFNLKSNTTTKQKVIIQCTFWNYGIFLSLLQYTKNYYDTIMLNEIDLSMIEKAWSI